MHVGEILLWFGDAMKSKNRKKLRMSFINVVMDSKGSSKIIN